MGRYRDDETEKRIHAITEVALVKFGSFYPIVEEVKLLAEVMNCDELEKFVTYAIPGGMAVQLDFENRQARSGKMSDYSFIDYAHEVINEAKVAKEGLEPDIHFI